MKKQIAILTASFIIIGLSTSFAQAGAARRHTIEGFLLGTGVTLLGTAIIHSMHDSGPVVVKTAPRHHHKHRYAKHHKKHHKGYRKGHWKTRKVWVEPVYKTRRNPGHYNKRGRWIPQRRQKVLVAEGYWEKERVRVRNRHRF